MSEKAADQDTSWFNKKPLGSHQVRLRRGQSLSPLAAPALSDEDVVPVQGGAQSGGDEKPVSVQGF